jgi:hypothetical protein
MEVSGHEKITIGITCAVVRGEELFLAQVLPSQAFIIHRGQLHAFPLNPSWDPEATTLPTMTMARLQALGWAEEVSPEFFHSPLKTGDVFCLTSSNIGRFLGRKEAEQILLYQEPGDVVEQLYRRIHQQGFSEAHAVVVEMEPAVSPASAPIFTWTGIQERAHLVADALSTWGKSLVGEVRRTFQRQRKVTRPAQPRRPQPRPRPDPEETPEIPSLARPKPSGPWWKNLAEGFRNLLHPKIRFPQLKRPKLRIQPQRERRRRPLFLALAAAALTVLAVLIYIIYQRNQQVQAAQVLQKIEQAQEQIALAAQTQDIEEANQILDNAEGLLEEALSMERDTPRVELEQNHLYEERDRINRVSRFSTFELLVDPSVFSTTIAAAGFTGGCLENCSFGDIAKIGESLYLLEEEKGTVYIYSPTTNEVVPILWEGMEIESRTVSNILAITLLNRPENCTEEGATEPWLAAVDSDRWLYLHHQGVWETYALYSEASWQDRAIDLEGYLGNIYVLKGEFGQILKYYCNAYELAPSPWIQDPRQAPAEDAVDMAIDGHIYLLMKSDGSALDLLQGELERTLTYEIYPPMMIPAQLYTDLDSNHLYVVDHYAGRIIQLRKNAEDDADVFVRQLKGPQDDDLQELRAITVDEDRGFFYMIARGGLYKGEISPLAPEAPPEPTVTPAP